MILTVESENECGATNSEESMCVSTSICMGGPVTKSLFYNGGNRAISSKRAKLSTVGPHNFVSLKCPSFSLFSDAFEVLPIV